MLDLDLGHCTLRYQTCTFFYATNNRWRCPKWCFLICVALCLFHPDRSMQPLDIRGRARDGLATSSSYGPSNRFKPDIVAPGISVLSASAMYPMKGDATGEPAWEPSSAVRRVPHQKHPGSGTGISFNPDCMMSFSYLNQYMLSNLAESEPKPRGFQIMLTTDRWLLRALFWTMTSIESSSMFWTEFWT